MIETITPAVCGSRRRHRLALAAFTLGAVGAALLVGALLGLAGSVLGAERAVVGVAILALAAAAREAGLLRLPLPQSRRQVPERWRANLPLPAWSFGYGAGLGLGVATFQPVATFWVACAAAVALARPFAAALCFSLYGLGRALTVVWPRRGDATAAVEGLARHRRTLARANAVALVACAVVLAAAPAAGAAPVSLGEGLDPSFSGGAVARAVPSTSSVLIQPSDSPALEIPAASSPALDGNLVAYEDAAGIRVVDWRTGEQIAQVAGAVSEPALEWPFLAYRRLDADYERIIVKDLSTGEERAAARYQLSDDVGRPSLRGGNLAWHHAGPGLSRILLMPLATWQKAVVARTKIGLLGHAAVTSRRIIWVDRRSRRSYVRLRRVGGTAVKTLWRLKRRDRVFWTTALTGRTAFVTRWMPATGATVLFRLEF